MNAFNPYRTSFLAIHCKGSFSGENRKPTVSDFFIAPKNRVLYGRHGRVLQMDKKDSHNSKAGKHTI